MANHDHFVICFSGVFWRVPFLTSSSFALLINILGGSDMALIFLGFDSMHNNKTNSMIWTVVMNMEQTIIAAGAGAMMVLGKIPLDMHCNDRVASMTGPAMTLAIENTMTKAFIGQYMKQIMQD
eukprot:13759949-Ditylum_brightwellii.AAC.1